MKKLLLLTAVLLGSLAAVAQDLDVSQYAGATVGAKITKAITNCRAGMTCILTIPAKLSTFSTGTIPSLCSGCYLADYRNGPPWATGGVPAPGGGSTLGGVQSKLCSTLGANYVVQNIGVDGVPTCVAVSPSGSAGAMILLEHHSAGTGTSSLAFTNCVGRLGYSDFELRVVNLRPAGSNGQLVLVFSVDGGATYDEAGGNAHYAWTDYSYYQDGAGQEGESADQAISLTGNSAISSVYASSGVFSIHVGAVGLTELHGTATIETRANTPPYWAFGHIVAGAYKVPLGPPDAFKLVMWESRGILGTFNSVEAYCYGIAHS